MLELIQIIVFSIKKPFTSCLCVYLFPDMNTLDRGSVTFTLERKPEHQEESPVFVVDKDGRDRWSRKIEFLFTCIGFCVGYGNIWRFPYMCFKNGGGRYR